MARSVISPLQWERAKEYFEAGLSLSEIEKKTEISRGALSKKSVSEQWDRNSPKKQLISQAIEVEKAKETLRKHPTSLEVHNEIVSENVRLSNKVFSIQERALDKADTMIDQVDTPNDLRTIVELVDKASITLKVSERHAPKSDVNVSNTTQVQNNTINMTKEEMIEEAKRRGIPLDFIGL